MTNLQKAHQSKATYWSGQVSQLTGLNVRTLNLWAAQMATPATLSQKITRGQPRRWFYPDLIVLRAAKILRDAGVPLPTVQQIVAHLRENADTDARPLKSKILLTDGKEFWVLDQERDVLKTLKHSTTWRSQPRVFMILHMNGIVKDVDAAWKRLRSDYLARQPAKAAYSEADP